jgi:hypothetical protein
MICPQFPALTSDLSLFSVLKDLMEFGDTGCADHEQSPPRSKGEVNTGPISSDSVARQRHNLGSTEIGKLHVRIQRPAA